eukprot:gene22537-15706_t
MMKSIFTCLAALALVNVPHADAQLDLGELVAGFLGETGVDQATTDALVSAMETMDTTVLLTLVTTGAFTDTVGGPVNLGKVFANELVQAAMVEADLDVTAISAALGIATGESEALELATSVAACYSACDIDNNDDDHHSDDTNDSIVGASCTSGDGSSELK